MGKRALVVDSCAAARSVLVVLLQRSGWEVIGAADGAEGLLLAGLWQFDLVITDREPTKIPLPYLVRALKESVSSPGVRVILLVEPDGCTLELEKLTEGVLVRNAEIEIQLHSLLSKWFGRGRHRRHESLPHTPEVPAATQRLSSGQGLLKSKAIDDRLANGAGPGA